MTRIVTLRLAVVLVATGSALAARGDPQKRITPADQARAKAMLLRAADLRRIRRPALELEKPRLLLRRARRVGSDGQRRCQVSELHDHGRADRVDGLRVSLARRRRRILEARDQ
jgi:hypothetical protein